MRCCGCASACQYNRVWDTPYYTTEELAEQGILYGAVSAFCNTRHAKAALEVMRSVREQGTQVHVLDKMQPRKELYEFLDYHSLKIP